MPRTARPAPGGAAGCSSIQALPGNAVQPGIGVAMRGRDRVEVRCPGCAGHALFEEPYEFGVAPPADGPSHRWGGWHVVEKHPTLLPWQAPKGSSSQYLTDRPDDGGGYPLLHRGVVACGSCTAPFIHTLAWPEDAWWQWSIRGEMLWAWDRKHAEHILAYVRATDRPPRLGSGPIGSVPTHFLSAKVREKVVKAIERSLAAAGSTSRPGPRRGSA